MAVNFWRRSKSGRSSVVANNIVATSQPLASQAGIQMMMQGGNAVDAAVAAAAVLNVVEPYSTGIGGDAFALLYIPDEKKPIAINGSGSAPQDLSYAYLTEELELAEIPVRGILPITVPGAVSMWGKLLDEYGNLSMDEVLAPAIMYAEDGFHASPVISQVWQEIEKSLTTYSGLSSVYYPAPSVGQKVKNTALAETFKRIALDGSDEFYKGDTASQMVEFLQKEGGFLSEKDLNNFEAEWTEPISKELYGYNLWEHGPNGQGLIVQLLLSIAQELDIGSYAYNSAEYIHLLVEAKKMAFTDGLHYICDPKTNEVPIDYLLSEEYSMKRASQISPNHALQSYPSPINMGEDTVYLATADNEGMSISFINSLFYGFGSAMVDPSTGVAFQCRGAGFSLAKNHPNQYEPGKRPYHTIIPGMITDEHDELAYSFGVMGGHHQPQGQAQVFLNLIIQDMDPQTALSAPRFHHEQRINTLAVESPIDISVKTALRKLGHAIVPDIGTNFGGGQIIMNDKKNGCYVAGSSPRKDGCANGF